MAGGRPTIRSDGHTPTTTRNSKTLHEFLRRIESQNRNVLILLGRGDPISAGSSGGLLGQALRRLCGIMSGEPLAVRQRKLTQRISQRLPPGTSQCAAEFIGELCGIPFSDERSPKLRAARQDPRIMADQLGLALTDFLQAECREQPVLLILEDLHWGDALTVKLIDAALRELREESFMVLGLARPEVAELFPNLWAGQLQPLPLRGLGRKAQERLVKQILGDRIPDSVLARLVEQAAGNALLLEELIRAVANGKGDDLPPTVMAMLQARIGQLDMRARRVLLAASVFGTTFWLGGLLTLLADERDAGDLHLQLHTLVEREILEQRRDSRFPMDPEYRFRHALLREAAYSLLTDGDRTTCHRLAGAYLEQNGETDSVLLAEHAHRGDLPERALPHFIRAAEQALDGNDLAAALHRSEQGAACGATGEALGALLTIRAAAHAWRGELLTAYQVGTDALALLPEGSMRWCKAMLTLFFVTTYLGKREHFAQLTARFRAVAPNLDASGAYVEAAAWLVMMLTFLGQRTQGCSYLERMYQISAQLADSEPSIRGWIGLAHGILCHWVENDLWQKQTLARKAIEAAELCGNRRMRGFATLALGLAQMYLGDFETGAETLRQQLLLIKQLPDEAILAGTTMGFCALGLTEEMAPQRIAEARAMAQSCMATVPATSPAAALAHISLARILAAEGSCAEAESHARQALHILRVEPVTRMLAYAALAKVLLQQGKHAEARELTESGVQLLESLDGRLATEVEMRLALAEARLATYDTAAAHAAIREALLKLQAGADKIPDSAVRARYLANVPTHARVLKLAGEWL